MQNHQDKGKQQIHLLEPETKTASGLIYNKLRTVYLN